MLTTFWAMLASWLEETRFIFIIPITAMKPRIFYLLLLLILLSCNQESVKARRETIQDFTCVNAQVNMTPTLSEVHTRIKGQWQLRIISAMIPNPTVENIKLIFSEDKVQVFKDGKQMFESDYILKENQQNSLKYIGIETTISGDNSTFYNPVRGTVRICEQEMLLDHGMAFDAPGYFFEKL